MSKEIAVFNYVLPVWFIVAHNKGEPLGEDERALSEESFYVGLSKLLRENNAYTYTIEAPDNIDESKYFSATNDVDDLDCDVCDCIIHLR